MPLIKRKNDNSCCCNNWKRNNNRKSNKEKRNKAKQKINKEVRRNTYFYSRVEIAINVEREIGESIILLSQYSRKRTN